MYLVIDSAGVVRCMASEAVNLFVRIDFDDDEEAPVGYGTPKWDTVVAAQGYVIVDVPAVGKTGDTYDVATGAWTIAPPPPPPEPTVDELVEQAMTLKMKSNALKDIKKDTNGKVDAKIAEIDAEYETVKNKIIAANTLKVTK